MKILLVDDDPLYLHTMAPVVQLLGHDALVATNGDDALDVLAKQAVELVISDYSMPGMNGEELMRAIKQRYPRLVVAGLSAKDLNRPADATIWFDITELKPIPDIEEFIIQCCRLATADT